MPLPTIQQTLEHVLAAAHVDPSRAAEVRFEGADPVLPTAFLMGTSGAAVLGAVGLAAADLWKLRGGGDQIVSMDARRGAIALRTSHYLRLEGEPAPDFWDPISGFHRTGDGWVQLHCQFPHFRDAVLRVLGCGHDRDAVATALLDWRAQDLEDRMVEEGVPLFMLRDKATWRRHPQAAAVAGLPLLEIIKIGDSPPEPLPAGTRPLAGVRVLDLTRVIAGPVTGRTLAAHGADVMRISGPHLPFSETLVMETGHGKRAAHIDLRQAEGVETLRGLVKDAHVFSQAYRSGTIAGRGFAPEDLAEMRPGIVCVSLCAWSHAGPWAPRRGYDSLVQCATGIAAEHGGADSPRHLPGQALDYLSGYLGAFGAMVALARRAREGGSYLVRLSLAQTAHWLDSLGLVETEVDPRDLPDTEMADVADLLVRSETSWGPMTHMGPILQMSETPPRWARPVVPLGTDAPAWL